MNSFLIVHRPPRQPLRLARHHIDMLGGALSGLGGGGAMIIIAAMLTYVLNQDPWAQLRLLAQPIMGSAATATSGFAMGPVLVGLLVHLSIAALLGVLFALLVRWLARLPSLLSLPEMAGLAYGLLLWAAVYFLVAPFASSLMLTTAAPVLPVLLIQHMVYGASTGLLYSMLRPQPILLAHT